jgi:hypothetical protein
VVYDFCVRVLQSLQYALFNAIVFFEDKGLNDIFDWVARIDAGYFF